MKLAAEMDNDFFHEGIERWPTEFQEGGRWFWKAIYPNGRRLAYFWGVEHIFGATDGKDWPGLLSMMIMPKVVT